MNPPWWIWVNVIGVDVCGVALVWQELLAWSAGVGVDIWSRAALVLAVLAIYLADKIGDFWRLRMGGDGAQLRHALAGKRVRVVAGLLAVVTICGVGVAILLPRPVLAGGVGLGVAIAGYFLWNQLAGERFGRLFLKEFVVSTGFAIGTGLVAIVGAGSVTVWGSVLVFAGVCLANSVIIAEIERDLDIARGEVSLATSLASGRTLGLWVALGSVGAAGIFWVTGGDWAVGLAGMTAGVLMAVGSKLSVDRRDHFGAIWPDWALILGGLAGLAGLAISGCRG